MGNRDALQNRYLNNCYFNSQSYTILVIRGVWLLWTCGFPSRAIPTSTDLYMNAKHGQADKVDVSSTSQLIAFFLTNIGSSSAVPTQPLVLQEQSDSRLITFCILHLRLFLSTGVNSNLKDHHIQWQSTWLLTSADSAVQSKALLQAISSPNTVCRHKVLTQISVSPLSA